MAYFEKDFDANFQYSYNGVNGWILGNYVNPTGIEAYIEDEVFYDAVKLLAIIGTDPTRKEKSYESDD